MSCCAGCQQGTGCDGLGNVSIVGGRVVPGTVIDWKGHILWPDEDSSIRWQSDAEARIKNILWAHGGFSQVDAGQISTSIFYQWFPEISVRVTTQVEFAYLGDVFNTIEGAIWQAGYRPRVIDFRVISVPPGTPQTPQVSQPGRAGGAVPQADNSWSLPNLPDIFGGSTGSSNSGNPIDRLAGWLGIGQTEAALFGAVAVVAGIVIVKKLL